MTKAMVLINQESGTSPKCNHLFFCILSAVPEFFCYFAHSQTAKQKMPAVILCNLLGGGQQGAVVFVYITQVVNKN